MPCQDYDIKDILPHALSLRSPAPGKTSFHVLSLAKRACTQGTKDCSHQACEQAFSEADLPAPVKPSCDVALADSLLQERPVSEIILLLTQSQILDIQNRKIIYFVLSFYILGKYIIQ